MFLGLDSDEWYALGTMLLGIGAVIGGFWALYNYHRTRRAEAATWLQGVFRDFYLADTFRDVRLLLEYSFDQEAGPLLERRITDRHVPISSEDVALLEKLDTLLNYFEHVLYLEEARQITRKDRQSVFEYWFDIMESEKRAALRKYAARFGFERVSSTLNATNTDYVAVYGSLRKGLALEDTPPELSDMLIDRGPCLIRGSLYDLGDYPGLKPGDGTVKGELYEICDPKALKLLDEYERYDALKPESSLYLRRCVRLIEPACDSWTYVFNGPIDGRTQVESGDWAHYQQLRS